MLPHSQNSPSVGIDDISLYIPNLYVDIHHFAKARGVDPMKLEKGLGLASIAVPDASEDVITMAAEALLDLVDKNNLQPEDIGRLYVGTESMVDGSKPNASYLLGVLQQYYDQHDISTDALKHCDVVDMTFACIGAVDAMQSSLDWIRLNPDCKAIVIATDWAKYDLHSPGECTQGAGAIALLLSSEPRVIQIDNKWGVSAKCEHDFFKPLRRKVNDLDNIISNGIDESKLGKEIVVEHKDTPVYDGHFSNACYTARVDEALQHYITKTQHQGHPLDRWKRLVFHLPYAYHARRIFTSIFISYLQNTNQWGSFITQIEDDVINNYAPSHHKFLKAASKTNEYQTLVQEKIQPGEIASSKVGNMYTASIFLSLISHLHEDNGQDLTGEKIGFFAYGSGSKSKVFEGKVMPGYKELISRIDIGKKIHSRKEINIHEYEYLHRHKLLINLDSENRKVFQTSSGWTESNRYARHYEIIS